MIRKSKHLTTRIDHYLTRSGALAGYEGEVAESTTMHRHLLFRQDDIIFGLACGSSRLGQGFRLALLRPLSKKPLNEIQLLFFLFSFDIFLNIILQPSLLFSHSGLVLQDPIVSEPHSLILPRKANADTIPVTRIKVILMQQNSVIFDYSEVRETNGVTTNISRFDESPFNVLLIAKTYHHLSFGTQDLDLKIACFFECLIEHYATPVFTCRLEYHFVYGALRQFFLHYFGLFARLIVCLHLGPGIFTLVNTVEEHNTRLTNQCLWLLIVVTIKPFLLDVANKEEDYERQQEEA